MPKSIAEQVAGIAAMVEHMNNRAEKDRQERKAAQAETERTRRATRAELTAIAAQPRRRAAQVDTLRERTKVIIMYLMVQLFCWDSYRKKARI